MKCTAKVRHLWGAYFMCKRKTNISANKSTVLPFLAFYYTMKSRTTIVYKDGEIMFTELTNFFDKDPLREIVRESFNEMLKNLKTEWPEEALEYPQEELSFDKMELFSVETRKSTSSEHTHLISAEYRKSISNNKVLVYILKIWDDMTPFDDVFYTEKQD